MFLFEVISQIETPEEMEKFLALYEKYKKSVYDVAYYYTKNKFDAEEVLQNVYEKIIRNLDTIEMDIPAKTKKLIQTISKHEALNLLKKKQREHCTSADVFDSLPDDGYSPYERAEVNDERRAILTSIKGLSEEDQMIFQYYYYHGKTSKEIAGIMNLNKDLVDKRLQRGRSKLEKEYRGTLR